ncbi:4-coumarate--CoA ligase-like 6 [Triticum aestivum]|uniref:4-coumarate--CoA ligase-like 6 n=1 Tax=Triticum aestivum TaxID=4565 RepID=UPI001D0161C4|nr:4-coumarate--CoA ligase-like 6 [Triticum aestivum]
MKDLIVRLWPAESIPSSYFGLVKRLGDASPRIDAARPKARTTARRRRHRHCRLLPVLHRLRPGDVALVVTPSRLEVPVLHFALMSIGIVVSPANPASTPEEYAHQIALSRPVVAFAAPEVAAKLPGHVRREGGSSAGRHAAPTPPVQRLRVHDGPVHHIHGGHGGAHGALRQFDFGVALRVILWYRVTLLPAAPPVLVAMIKSKEACHRDLSSLHIFAVGGTPLGRDVAERFAAVFTNVQIVQVKHETPCRLQNTTESSMHAGREEEG